MTMDNIKLIRVTWDAIRPEADDAMAMFYQRLFEIDPTTRPLFAHTSMSAQRKSLAGALDLLVENAGQIDGLAPVLQELGRRHVRYGVEDHHYDSVGAALLWTLAQQLGPAFTDEARAAWTITYAVVSGTMRRAATEMQRAAA
jgi:hemoglobin-like flavoprotein